MDSNPVRDSEIIILLPYARSMTSINVFLVFDIEQISGHICISWLP